MAAAVMACSLVGIGEPASHGGVWIPRPRRRVLRALDSDPFTGIVSFVITEGAMGSVAEGTRRVS